MQSTGRVIYNLYLLVPLIACALVSLVATAIGVTALIETCILNPISLLDPALWTSTSVGMVAFGPLTWLLIAYLRRRLRTLRKMN